MDEFEKVEKLRTKANVSFEEAKQALEAANGDLLDAMIYLERQGKVNPEGATNYAADAAANQISMELPAVVKNAEDEKKEDNRTKAKECQNKFVRFIKKAWQKSIDNEFVVERNDKEIIRVPVIVLIVALIGAWGICVPLLIVGLFLSCRYSFDGKDDLAGFNNAMDKAGQTAENIKNEFR